jgi:NADPH2:quinone reductase
VKAAFYERFGPASDVLQVGDLDAPKPGAGEVLVRIEASGVNPSDVKLRAGQRPGATMPYSRVIPHSDGAGVIEFAGPWADRRRVGQRVWLWNGQWRRAYGTAAEYIAIPAEHAVPLPDATSFEAGACLGIPAMTAWAAVLGDGPVEGKTVLVTGGAGSVGRFAAQIARLAGARVIATVSSEAKAAHVRHADHVVNYRTTNVVAAVNDITYGAGVDRVVDVDFGVNLPATSELIREGGTIVAYASAGLREPALPFYPLMFRNVTLRMLLVYLLDPEARKRGIAHLTRWLETGALDCAVAATYPLEEIAAAHAAVEAGEKLGTIVVRPT